MSLNIEFVGGPRDGQHLTFGDTLLAHCGARPPKHIALIEGQKVVPSLGRYVITTEITRAGRLIYEHRRPEATPHH